MVMKIVAAMLLALMLSACDPGLIDDPTGHWGLIAGDQPGDGLAYPDPRLEAGESFVCLRNQAGPADHR
ncbi:hypothetical protein LG3211_5013 [Lysobacter gummosus]|nr:hypothetical protein LG3211_5013 [Lysobacter gummosus]